MNPFKAGQVLSSWLLRITLVAYIVLLYMKHLYPINLNSFNYFVALGSVVFAILLLLGGVLSKQTLTVISGLLIFFVSVFLIVKGYSSVISHGSLLHFVPAALGFYFFSKGNGQ